MIVMLGALSDTSVPITIFVIGFLLWAGDTYFAEAFCLAALLFIRQLKNTFLCKNGWLQEPPTGRLGWSTRFCFTESR